MRWSGGLLAAMALLAGCRSEAPAPDRSEPAVAPSVTAEVKGPERRILAFGDSLFAGYRLNDGEGYPDRLQEALRAQDINASVIDAGVSGDTTAAGAQRIAFVLDSLDAAPELAIVELGGNDLLRAIPPTQARQNLATILTELRKRQIPVLLMGMRAPPNLGDAYVAEFDGMYGELAAEYGAKLVPFFIKPVYDKPALLQQDHIHPTAKGVEALVAATVDDVVAALPKAS